ncbi:MAG: hypothetical protein WD601_06100 [Pseudohongiellaceae bacterium]
MAGRRRGEAMNVTELMCGPGLEPAEPLYARVPIRDETGQYLSDFMMIIPGLRKRSAQVRQEVISRINHVLQLYRRTVVFADLNMKNNVLWVSVKPVPGICLELPAVIKFHVPEALLVSHRLPG